MNRWLLGLGLIGISALSFSSCTCQRDLPDPPPAASVARKGGFGALGPTAREIPEAEAAKPVAESRLTPIPPTLPAAEGTPTASSQVELPENFPSDIPIYENAELYAVQELAQSAKNVLFYVDAESPEVFTYYKNNMRGEGWDVAQEYTANEQSFLSFRKGRTIANVTIVKDPNSGRRVVAVMYYEEEELPFPEF
jgi:hypothetical protein